MISLEGLQSGVTGEDRAIAILKVEHNSLTYDWMTFVPPDADLATYIAASEGRVKAEIDAKEAAWAAIDLATQATLDKSDIVRADNPDYYASRRAEYPSLADQLDAMWKGADAMTEMAAKIAAVKAKYPKP
jgi:hypothetical protein